MKKTVLLFFLLALSVLGVQGQSTVFDPSDPIVEYDEDNPPAIPPWGTVSKWVRTSRLSWDTDSYKAYYFKGMCFRLKFPVGYDPNGTKKYPLIVMLHGRGEKGTIYDNENSMKHGGTVHRDAIDNGVFDGFVLFPQSTNGFWGENNYLVMDELINNHFIDLNVDMNRVSLHGLSAGGQGVFKFIAGYPKTFACAIPMSAASLSFLDNLDNYEHMPIWLSQGGEDRAPDPGTSQVMVDEWERRGMNYTYTLYPDLGHGVWNRHYGESDFFPFMIRANRTNPLVFFGKTEFCPGDVVSVRMKLAAGFEDYEWRKNGQTITGVTTNEFTATSFGTYDVRFKSNGDWSQWSEEPVVIKEKEPTVTPPIQISGSMSYVLPAPDGKSYVNLEVLESNYVAYEWRKVGSSAVLGTERVFAAPGEGQYTVSVLEEFGCASEDSEPFTVLSAEGTNLPSPALGLAAFAKSQTEVELRWSDNINATNNETGFEVYRGESEDGPYEFVALTEADVLSFSDAGLKSNQAYYYIVRAINDNGASAISNEAMAVSLTDTQLPTPPSNLTFSANDYSVTLSWSASSDNVGVDRYEVYQNGVRAAVVEETTATVYNLQREEIYNFYVIAKDFAGNYSPASEQLIIPAAFDGLNYRYFEGEWSELPDFNSLQPAKTGKSAAINLDVRERDANYALYWEGFFNVKTADYYRFATRSDDGSKLYFGSYDEADLLVDNDGLHGSRWKSSEYVYLTPGAYPIVVTFFQRGGGYLMDTYWDTPNSSWVTFDESDFSSGFVMPGSAPEVPSGLNATGVSYNQIDLSWTDESNNESGFQVFRSESEDGDFVPIAVVEENVTSYNDTLELSSETTYYYQVVAVGAYGISEASNAESAITLVLPPAPPAPDNLVATTLSSSSIQLTWLGSGDEGDKYVIYRSAGDNNNFIPIANIQGGTNANLSFIDEGLFANITYYYQVESSNVGGISPSMEVSSKTSNTIPELESIEDITMKFGTSLDLNIYAEDIDGEPLSLTVSSLPDFAQFYDYGDGTGLIQFTPISSDLGEYENIEIQVEDQNGGVTSVDFTLIVDNNNVPQLELISDIALDEGEARVVNLLASDLDGTASLLWTTEGLPMFASLQANLDGSAQLSIEPDYVDAGVYQVEVVVSDDAGGKAIREFLISVSDIDPNQSVFINIGQYPDAENPWNNIVQGNTQGLLDGDGEVSGVGIEFLTSAWNVFNLGAVTGDNSGVYPDNVMKDYYYFGIFGAPETVDIKLSGLDPLKAYDFTFFGSSTWGGVPDNGETVYSIGQNAVTLDVQNNNSNTVTIKGATPDTNGDVIVKLSKGTSAPLGYLNALVINYIHEDGQVPATPTNLAVVFDGTVALRWNDLAFNEAGYEVFRSESEGGPFTNMTTTPLPAGTKDYIDGDALENTTYYYKVQALNEYGTSSFSNTVEVNLPNLAPKVVTGNNFVGIAGKLSELDITATDLPNNNVSVAVNGILPSFASFSDLGGGNAKVILAPSEEDLGVYEGLEIVVSDENGGVTKLPITIEVKENVLYSVSVNFSNTFSAPSPWNNTGKLPAAEDTFPNLMNDSGVSSPIGLTLIDAFGGAFGEGAITGDDSGIVPDNALKEYYWFGAYGASESVKMKVTGLSTDYTYNFRFVGSSLFNGSGIVDNGETIYSIRETSSSLNVQANTLNEALIKGITTDASGEVIIELSKGFTASVGYINALIVEVVDGKEDRFDPSHLTADAKSTSTIELNWIDNAFDESGYEIYRSLDPEDGFSLIYTTDANVSSYVDSRLDQETVYYYKVKGVFGNNPSAGFSNVANSGTISYAIYVNINGDSQYDAPEPWNNLGAAPSDGDVFVGFKNSDVQQETGIRLYFEKAMQGSNNWGTTTGDDSGVYPDNVLESFFFNDAFDPAGTIVVEGLSAGYKYNFTFLGSIATGFNIVTNFEAGGEEVSNRQANNTSETVTLKGLVVNDRNEIEFKVEEASGSRWAIFNAFVIEAIPNNNLSGTSVVREEGTFRDGNVREVNFGNINNIATSAYPNPFKNVVNVDYNSSSVGDVNISLIDMLGKVIYNKKIVDAGRSGSVKLDLQGESLNKGLYIIEIEYPDGRDVIKTMKN